MILVDYVPVLPELFSLGLVGVGLVSWLGDDGSDDVDQEGDGEGEFDMGEDDAFGMDEFDEDFGEMDGMDEGGGATSTELENRIEDLESEIATVSSTANTVRSENEQISEKVEDVEENVRKLLEIYEMVTRGVNPFVDDVSPDAGLGGGGGSDFGLFGGDEDPVEEPEADLESDIADAEAEDFFENDAFEADFEDGEAEFEPDADAFDEPEERAENEQTVFVVGETASGKTTTLNSIMAFIPRDSKIYTAEDTAEVLPPHDTWQQLLTREGQGENSADVDMFDLVAAALRSRPDYIVVGEVRGEEGRMAFQAAQTGHPVMLTFHASDIVSMIQRFTGDPINVPETFMDNADVALFQNRVKQGDDVLRRVTSVQEIEGYSKEMGGVVTRQSFYWDPVEDEIVFQGRNNSYLLEEQIATLLGYEDTREIYDEMDFRTEIIERIIQENLIEYHDFNDVISAFQRDGVEGLPFTMARRDL